MKQPKNLNTDERIKIEPNPHRIRVVFHSRIVADTRRALTLREVGYAPVHYVPREDVRMEMLERSAHASHCPYKGDAAYFSIRVGDRTAENAVWTYEQPYPQVAGIKDHVAFYPGKVDAIEELSPQD